MSDIPISPKHGLNPALVVCPCCGADEGVALMGRLKDDAEAPRRILDVGPCSRCTLEFEALKDKGFVLFVIADAGINGPPWPHYRGLHVITRDAASRLFRDVSLHHGCAFISETFAREIGLELPPRT